VAKAKRAASLALVSATENLDSKNETKTATPGGKTSAGSNPSATSLNDIQMDVESNVNEKADNLTGEIETENELAINDEFEDENMALQSRVKKRSRSTSIDNSASVTKLKSPPVSSATFPIQRELPLLLPENLWALKRSKGSDQNQVTIIPIIASVTWKTIDEVN
jgi:hypothetical protein